MVREALMEALAHRSRLPPRSPYLTGDVEAPIRWGLGTRRAESLSGPLAEAKKVSKQWGAGRQSKRNGFGTSYPSRRVGFLSLQPVNLGISDPHWRACSTFSYTSGGTEGPIRVQY